MKSQSSIKRKIRTVTSIRKVTNATAAIANIRLQALFAPLASLRNYRDDLAISANDISGHIDQVLLKSAVPFFRKGRTSKVLFMVFTSDKGLCGMYNSRLLQDVAEASRTQIRLGRKLSFISFGRHASEYLSKMNRNVIKSYPAVCLAGSQSLARELLKEISEMFVSKAVDEVHLFYNRFVSVGKQDAGHSLLLPLDFSELSSKEKRVDTTVHNGDVHGRSAIRYKVPDFELDPPFSGLLKSFLSHYLEIMIRMAILESAAGEQAARMSAMQESTSNADDLIKDLSMEYNKMRQAQITRELIEVVSSAEALN